MKYRKLVFCAVLLTGAAFGQIVHSHEQMVVEGVATAVNAIEIDLPAGIPVTFETASVSAGGDPVLHILLSSTGREVAVDDNSAGGKAARIAFTPPVAGRYQVVVRARSQGTVGTCDILRNGAVLQRGAAFGGWQMELPNLRALEEVETIRLPGGAGPIHSLYVLKPGGLGIDLSVAGPRRASGGRWFAVDSASAGSRQVIVAVPPGSWPGRVRLVRNDVRLAGHDPDGDGLGTELENALGTCASATSIVRGFDCRRVADPRDTDGDGISDGWEVLGRSGYVDPVTKAVSHAYEMLPLWGADPLHKDVFFEVDFMLRQPGEPARRMSDTVARQFARLYQDEVAPLTAEQSARHAASLRNPDGRPGIHVHLDTGVDPTDPRDVTLFGNWGGHNAVPPVRQADGSYAGLQYSEAWKTNMWPSRRGIFLYMIPYAGGGGSTELNGVACTFGIDGAAGLAHECGHALGLNHSGPPAETGPVVDPTCNPNYPSLMNYTFLWSGAGFSDGAGGPPLNNAALREWNAVPAAETAYLNTLRTTFQYNVDTVNGHVDWNRDGLIAPAGTTVRAFANLMPGDGSGCGFTNNNYVPVGTAKSMRSPGLVRIGNRLYVFYIRNGALKYTYSTSDWNCPGPTEAGCPGATWSAEMDAGLAAGGVDAGRVRVAGREYLAVVAIDAGGRVVEKRMTMQGTSEVWTPWATIGSTSAAGEPSIAAIDGGLSAFVVYKGTDSQIRYHRFNAGAWGPGQVAVNAAGAAITSSTAASPAIVRAYLAVRPAVPELYGAFTDASGRLDIWWFNTGTTRWEPTGVLDARPDPLWGGPRWHGRPRAPLPNTRADFI